MFIHPLLSLLLLFPSTMAAFKPYVLGSHNSNMDSAGLQAKLTRAGFQVLGTYSPSKGYTTVSFTYSDLKKEACDAEVPFGAVLRASLVQNKNDKTELSYCEPRYWANAMRLKGRSSDARLAKLQDALGNEGEFGSAKGLTEKKLRNYNYAMGMPRVTDWDTLHQYDSHAEAIDMVKKGLLESPEVTEVYSLDLDKNKRLIGVSLEGGKGSDPTVLGVTDAASDPKMGGLYGPYEIFIHDGQVLAPRGRFRIAIAFPDLTMGTFMKISSAPGAILNSLKDATSTACVTQ